QIDFGGEVIQNAQFEPPGGAELVGVGAAIIILLITFGSLLAMGLPILSALFGIGIGLSLVLLFANFISVPNFTPQIASMIAIGGAAAVFVTMLASITLLPAVIGFVGRNIDKLHIPRLRRTESLSGRGFWYRWSRLIQRRPAMTGVVGLAAVVLLTVPLFSMR